MMNAWNNFKANLNNWGIEFHFFWVKEYTPPSHEYTDARGRRRVSVGQQIHLHAIIDRHIPSAILKAAWKLSTDCSFIIDIRRVEGVINVPAGYMTKYLLKSAQSELFKKGEHRYGCDRENDWSAASTPIFKIEGIDWLYDWSPQFPMMAKLSDSPAGGKIPMAEEPPP